MRRWNGWGDDATGYPLPASAGEYLRVRLGPGDRIPDAGLEALTACVPASRLPPHLLVDTGAYTRLRHARGQSLPDWAALRYGRIDAFPDGVATPQDEAQVRGLLDYAKNCNAQIIPYGGGTSVVGHINPSPGAQPALTVDLSSMSALLDLDETSLLATFEAGVCGPDLETALNSHGYTLGHFPQSFELSTLGGWVASRSSGQQSFHYGRIENLFAGGRAETPCGPLDLPPLPASAAGPDLRQALLGSEGRLGILTRATVRLRRLPEREAFYGVFFHDWEAGVEAVRSIVQAGVRISMARLSSAQETETTLALAGKDDLVAWADRGLRLAGYDQRRCLLIYSVTGEAQATRRAAHLANSISRKQGGLFTGQIAGKLWRKSRFLTPYLRNTLWEVGYAVDTLETALPWKGVIAAAEAIQSVIHTAFAGFNERALVNAHLSHVYSDGASIYITIIFRRTADGEQTLERWRAMKAAASREIVAHGGTISHQHGVGSDHIAYLPSEKSPAGMALLRSMARALDPGGMMNPGKLFDGGADECLPYTR